jgi:hypothetical protein
LAVQVEADRPGGSIHYPEAIIVSIPTEVHEGSAATYSLLQNYPNRSNPNTRISFLVAKSGPICIEISNIRGQKIAASSRIMVKQVGNTPSRLMA